MDKKVAILFNGLSNFLMYNCHHLKNDFIDKVEGGDVCEYELKNANYIHEYGLYIPNHPFLKKEEIEKICELVNK